MISRDSSEFQEVINRERIHERERFDILVNQMEERYKYISNPYDFTVVICVPIVETKIFMAFINLNYR